jgi:hypothetical protein
MNLKINSIGQVSQLIERYTIWIDVLNFYEGPKEKLLTHSEDGIPCYHYGDLIKINSNKNQLIAIDCLTEGVHSKKFFNLYNTSNKYLIFTNGNWDREFHNLKIDYEIMYHKFFLYEMSDTYNTPNRMCYYLDKDYKFYDSVPYIFISTIGNVRSERDLLVNSLKSKLKYDNYLLKYSGEVLNGDDTGDVITVSPGNFDPYTPVLTKYFHNISQTLPIKIFNKARFNLIVETDLDWEHEFFLTEKTIKNLIIGMPFVVVATPYFLKNLKELGFETYSTLWDESYDTIESYPQRVDKIMELCNNLSVLDWQSVKDELIRIGNHNRLNFLSLNKELTKEFVNIESTINKLKL